MVGAGTANWELAEYIVCDCTPIGIRIYVRRHHDRIQEAVDAFAEAVEAFDWLAAWKATRVALARWAESRRRRPRPPLGVRPPAPPALWGSSLRAFTAC